MSVYVLIPVFNRLKATKQIIEKLLSQKLDQSLVIVVIDDGSTDGTSEFLKNTPSLVCLQGNGSLFWGGAIALALNYLKGRANQSDWVLLLNNDTDIQENYCAQLISIARENYPAVVGTLVRNEVPPHQVLSYGALIDPWTFTVQAITKKEIIKICPGAWKSDVLSGRGTLYPYKSLANVSKYFSVIFPHYFGDYWLSLHARRLGFSLLTTENSETFSSDHFGSNAVSRSLFQSFFGKRSPGYIVAKFGFWWSASNFIQKITAPLRLTAFLLMPRSRDYLCKKVCIGRAE